MRFMCQVIIGILSEMSEQSSLVSLLGPLPDQDTSLHSLLQSLECQARIVHEKVGEMETSAANDPPVFTFTEKAPVRAFSWVRRATSAFTFTLKTLWRHYAKQEKALAGLLRDCKN